MLVFGPPNLNLVWPLALKSKVSLYCIGSGSANQM